MRLKRHRLKDDILQIATIIQFAKGSNREGNTEADSSTVSSLDPNREIETPQKVDGRVTEIYLDGVHSGVHKGGKSATAHMHLRLDVQVIVTYLHCGQSYASPECVHNTASGIR